MASVWGISSLDTNRTSGDAANPRRRRAMMEEELERRLLTYMDAIVAFAIVNLIAFTSAIADPEVRCAFAYIRGAAISINLLFGLGYAFGLMACDRARQVLRRAREGRPSALVGRFERRLLAVRYVLVAFATLGAVGAIVSASFDTTCAGS